MTYEEKVRWLWRYRDNLRLERTLREELAAQQSRACKTTAVLTGMPGAASDGATLARSVENIIRAQQELQAQINLCGVIRREVVDAINQIDNERDHEILRRRYLLGQSFEQISAAMCLEYRWVRRVHNKTVSGMNLCGSYKLNKS